MVGVVKKVFQIAAALFVAMGIGCGKKVEEPAKPVAEIKGKPINAPAPMAAAETNVVVEVAKTNVVVAAENSAGETPVGTGETPVLPTGVVTNGPVKSVVENVSTNAEPEVVDGYLKVGFENLAGFEYVMPDDVPQGQEAPKDQIPPKVKELNAKPVALRGFMLPLKVEKGLVTEMLLMRDQSMCCFGTAPKINEWVSVKMTEKGVKPVMDTPVTMFGKLQVGEMKENGYLVGIYQLDGDKMEEN